MVCMNIGAYTFALGIACRFGLHVKPDSRGIYITEYFFVMLSPCAFIAADYILLGRLARYLGSERHLLVPPSHITITFIVSDITTFLIQATGGAVSVGATTTKGYTLGSHVRTNALPLYPNQNQFSHLDIPWRSDYPTDLFSYLYTDLFAFCVSCAQI